MDFAESWIGGARLDIFNVTWPFAKLTLYQDKLDLKVKFWGSMSFTPEQITKIETVGMIPYLWRGIQIHHNLDSKKYPSKVIFWLIAKDTQNILEELRKWNLNVV